MDSALSPSTIVSGFGAGDETQVNPMLPKSPHFAPKAKHVIHIFANGGPSHVDTFDPKPSLQKYAGEKMPGRPPRQNGPQELFIQVLFAFKSTGSQG